MMKNLLLITFLLISTFLFAQTEDSIDMNGGYAMDVFYSLENGTVQTVANAEWTIAMSVGAQTASIYINDGNGVDLYETTEAMSDFATVDTAGIDSWVKSYNSYTSWNKGAFEANATGHPHYGWGSYNSVSNIVNGEKVYIVKTLANDYLKAMVVKKESGAWHYRYATLDNSFDTTIVYQATDLVDRNFAYLNMDNHSILNREPANTDWDMLFTKYYDTDISYLVTGVLVNKGVEIVQVDGVSNSSASYTNETFSDETKSIGSDWKTFNPVPPPGVFVLESDRTYFVKQLLGDIYKLYFTRFDGSSTGKTVFNKEKIQSSPIQSIDNINSLSIYPNPTKGLSQLILDLNKKTNISYSIYNMLGKQLSQTEMNLKTGLNVLNIDVSSFASGIYLVQIKNGAQVETIKLNVTK